MDGKPVDFLTELIKSECKVGDFNPESDPLGILGITTPFII